MVSYSVNQPSHGHRKKKREIREAQNVRMPWKHAAGLPFISPLTPDTQDLSLLKWEYIAFSPAMFEKTTSSSGVSCWRHMIALLGASSARLPRGLLPSLSNYLWFLFPWSHDFFHWDQKTVTKKVTGHLFSSLLWLYTLLNTVVSWGGINNCSCATFFREKGSKEEWHFIISLPGSHRKALRAPPWPISEALSPPTALPQQIWRTIPGTEQSKLTHQGRQYRTQR